MGREHGGFVVAVLGRIVAGGTCVEVFPGAGMYRGDCVPGEGGDVIRYVLRSLDGTVSNLRGDGGDASARPAGLQYFAVRNSVGTDVLYSRTEILSSAKTQWGLVSRL